MSTKTTKSGTIFKLVSRQSGATLAQLVKATGWKAPSVHAGLTGLRKQPRLRWRRQDRSGTENRSSSARRSTLCLATFTWAPMRIPAVMR